MKAVIVTKYGPPDVLKIKDIPKPKPKDNEVLIKIIGAAVVNTDPIFRKGEPFISRLFSGLTKPKHSIPGDVLSGKVETVGDKVKNFKPGDAVFGVTNITCGAHAEYICLPENSALAIKPEQVSYTEAAAASDGLLVALSFLRDKGEIQKGQRVLINGASGSVGSAAVQLAKHFGAVVTGVCSSTNIEMVKSIGADDVIDYTKEDFTKNGKTYDIIFDAVAKRSFCICKKSLTENGIYLTTVPDLKVLTQWIFTSIFCKKKARFAATGLRPAQDKAKDLNYIKSLLEKSIVRSVIDKSYTLNQIVDAHRYVEDGHKKGNVVLNME